MGYEGDKERIPGIDILVNDQQTWIYKNFEAERSRILWIPEGTLLVIVINFENLFYKILNLLFC